MKNIQLQIKNNIFKIFIELFIFNKTKRANIKTAWAKKNLVKYIDEAVLKYIPQKDPKDNQTIWQYWHQGKENAPELIKKCFESVEKHEKDKKIIVLSFDTIKKYVKLPQKYYDLVNSGKMPIALFSDILRMYLLTNYGGCWIDSTIYLTASIPDEIMNADFCVLQKDPQKDNQKNKMSCFFIKSKSNSINLNLIRNSLENYWQENDFVLNYFMFEHISTILSNRTPELESEWNKMPYYSATDSGELQKIMFKEFNQEEFDTITTKTPIHKLTYKKLNDNIPENSYYNYIINNEKKS